MNEVHLELKNKAISLRKEGKTYSEILKAVPVAKSTLSLWLRSVGIAKAHEQEFTEKKRLASLRGGQARHKQRLELVDLITKEAEKDVGQMTKRELWLIGTALYWAEGSKEKDYHPGSMLSFSNSDYRMISLYLKWLQNVLGVKMKDITCEIYIHDMYKNVVGRFRQFWSQKTGLPISYFDRVYFKRNKINTKRRNQGDLYNGLLRVKVLRSSTLNRRIAGWVSGINKYWGIV